MKHRKENKIADYQQFLQKKRLFLALLVSAVLVVALVAIASGSSNIDLFTVCRALLGRETSQSSIIVLNLRLPRVATAIVAGFGLGAVGCVMQSILRNPLASASTIGVSQGAAFGAAFAIIALGGGVMSSTAESAVSVTNPYLVSGCAFAGSMLSTLFILGISRLQKMSASTLVLSGVALSSLFSAGTTMLEYFANDVQVAAVVFWTFGNLGSTFWREIGIMFFVVLASTVYFAKNSWNYNALQGGEDTAKGLGVNTDRLLIVGMVVCSFTASVIVSYIGIISFVGLIAPHMVRKFVGSDYRFLLPASGLMGAVLLLVSDTVARLAVKPIVLPIGAITSILGAPLFLYIIFKGGRRS